MPHTSGRTLFVTTELGLPQLLFLSLAEHCPSHAARSTAHVIGRYVSREKPIGLKKNGPAFRNEETGPPFQSIRFSEFQNKLAAEHCQLSHDL